MSKHEYGGGAIDRRGPDTWRLRWRANGQRCTKTFHGTLLAARKELRALVKAVDDGQHVAPTRLTLRQWTDQWLTLLSREVNNTTLRRSRGLVSARTRERYGELLTLYVLPSLGERPLQKLTVSEIDKLYIALEQRLSTTSVRHIHVCLRACLATAVRKDVLQRNPSDNADVPTGEDGEVGQALDQNELKRLLDGFRGKVLYPLVCTAAFTGCRLGELLALRWSDLDPAAGTLRIERSIERTKEFGHQLKKPKSWRGKRTIELDPALLAMLLGLRKTFLHQVAGVPDGTEVDLSLMGAKLPSEALIFCSPAEPLDLTRLRNPNAVTRETRARFRKLGFKTLRFHDLRTSHGTALLNAGVPVHVVAARLGHDPAVLLRHYAKRTKRADNAAAAVIATLSQGIL
jgi:integrase